jgi:dethiobiotin synthetase
MKQPIFITATDTHVGKTVTTAVLGTLLQTQGIDVGIMKPVQCGGDDAKFLKKLLNLSDEMDLINPIYAPEPLSPHLALKRAKKTFDLKKVKAAMSQLQKNHDQMLIEGAGGLMVPLKDGYYNADLIRDLKAEIIIVARLGLGTINHTLLTINQAKAYKLSIRGIIFSDVTSGIKSLPERTNPDEIAKLSGVPVLGTIPYLKPITRDNIILRCLRLALEL